MTFLEIALDCLRRGWWVFPCKPRDKVPLGRLAPNGYQNASNDESVIRAWWTAEAGCNVGIATGKSRLAVSDFDIGLTGLESLRAFMLAHNITETYAVHTGRRVNKKDGSPAYGVQLYYADPDSSVTTFDGWEQDGCSGDVRANPHGYVMASGSIHPESGEQYEALIGTPDDIVPVCNWVRALKRAETAPRKPGEPGKKVPEGGGRHDALMRVACGLRNRGLDGDAIYAAMVPINPAMCEVPIDDEDLRAMCSGIERRYPVGEPDPVAVIGAPAAPVEVCEDAEELEGALRPKYPDHIWSGTPYGEFADLCTADNFIPRKFFSESIRTVVGALVGDRLTCPKTGVSPRAYTILIGPPGCGKGTANDRIWELFGFERWDGLERTEAPMLWKDPKEFIWRGRGMGAQSVSAASAPGLMKAIEERKLKKGEQTNPLETWRPIPRIITIAEEVRSLFANFANESTGAGLESVLCELYDRDSFTSTATKDRAPTSGRLLFSMLGGITKEGWDSVFSKVESTDSGFLSRVNILGTEEKRTVGALNKPDFGPLRNRLLPLIQALEKTPRNIDTSPAALSLMDKWYAGLELPEGISRARLNIHAWRTALHLAWLHGHAFIMEVDIASGIEAAEYLAAMREFYAPPEGETRNARCEATIRKVMRARRKLTKYELKQKTNYSRFGIGPWEESLKALIRAGELRVEGKTVILLILKD
jgi:hypothetical protein